MGGVGGILCLAEILRGQAALIKGNVVKVIKIAAGDIGFGTP